MSATESFISQLEKAASGHSLDIIEFSTVLEDIDIELEEDNQVEEVEEILVTEEEQEEIKEPEPIISGDVLAAMGELQSLFEGISGMSLEEEEKEEIVEEIEASEEVIEEVAQPQTIVSIDPAILEEAAEELKGLFYGLAGTFKEPEPELEDEKIEPLSIEEKYYNLPVSTPKYEISEVSKALIGKASSVMNLNEIEDKEYNIEIFNPTVAQGDANWQMNLFANEKNTKMAKMVNDVANLLEKHKGELPEEQYNILEGNAVEQTVQYLNQIAISEEEEGVVTAPTNYDNPEFENRVSGILRKVLSNVGWGQQGMTYGSGEVLLKRLDDVDATNISATHQFLAWDASVNKFVAAEGTTPVGDISGVVAGTGLSGGGTSGTVTLNLDTVSVTLGGTGLTTAAKGSVLVANAADTFSALSGSTDGDVLTYNADTDTVSWEGSLDGGTY